MMKNRFKTPLLHSLLTGLMVVMGNVAGGTSGMVLAFFMALAMNFVSYHTKGVRHAIR